MRYLPILLAMTLAGVGALPQTASAEAGEEGAVFLFDLGEVTNGGNFREWGTIHNLLGNT